MQQDEIRTTLAAAHAAGSLDGALQVLVEAQSSIAPVGEQIVLRRQLAESEPGAATSLTEELSTLPAVIQDAAIRALARRAWKAPIPGVKILELDLQTTADARLLRIMPNAAPYRINLMGGAKYPSTIGGSVLLDHILGLTSGCNDNTWPAFGDAQWESIAMFYMTSIVHVQGFPDGNKRTGHIAYAIVLIKGTHQFKVPTLAKENELFRMNG